MSGRLPVHLVKGSDDVLRGEALTALLDRIVGDADRTLVIDEFDLDNAKLGAAIDAAQTPPFLTDFRIVVVRRFGRYSKQDEVAPVVAYLEDALDSTSLVLVWEKTNLSAANDAGEPFTKQPKLPPTLTKAVTAAGGELVETDVGKNVEGWISEQFRSHGLDVEPSAVTRIKATVGEDAGAVIGLIERLVGTYGAGSGTRCV